MLEKDHRTYWLEMMIKIVDPVLRALDKQELKKIMPVECKQCAHNEEREHVTHLEALGRTLVGIAPWLALENANEDEKALIHTYGSLARSAIDAGTDPQSKDYMNFGFLHGRQPIVDAAFLAQSIIRAPKQLYQMLDARVQENLKTALKQLRFGNKPGYNNWLLFSAMIEVALCKMGDDWDHMRVDYALRQMNNWYVGDGMYADGVEFHYDYYNSYVIQPMLMDILQAVSHVYPEWEQLRKPVLQRAVRYASIQEKLIAQDGSFPVVGRSICYRFGAFACLAHVALMQALDENLPPAQVRCALTAVLRRTMDQPQTFDENGWLTIGLSGHQPALGENYISTGSLYLCTIGFLPLGLPAENEFWAGDCVDWSWKRVWGGENMPADHAL